MITKNRKISLLTINVCIYFMAIFFGHSLYSQTDYNHDYPRIAIYQWNTRAPASWFAKFDIMVTASNTAAFAKSVKQINPKMYILFTRDINAGQGAETFYSQWTALNSKGEKVMIYNGNRALADLTDYCPLVGGKRYNQVVAEYLTSINDFSAFDGNCTDGMIEYPGTWAATDIDLDRNGVNDWTEHGESWIKQQWTVGNNKILNDYTTLNKNKIFLVNSGNFHDFGWTISNGVFIEHSWAVTNWNYFRERYADWMSKARTPHTMILEGSATFRESGRPAITKNDFQLVQFLLGTCLMGDAYFMYIDLDAGEHFFVKYYDEYDVKLGYPTGNAQKIYVEGDSWAPLAVWVRFFDNGVSILNAKGKPQTVTDADLAKLSGYAGPYYRFQGGQNPTVNDGSRFTSSTLGGYFLNQPIGKVLGDGLLLLKSPQKVVSEIVIDNVNAGTSPASEPATLTGNWINQQYGNSFTMEEASWMGVYGYASTSAGDGSTKATFKPTIGVAGNYEVFEWHGYFGDTPTQTVEATNVPCTITLGAGKTINLTINQSTNFGQWNSLGTYYFSKGTDGQLVITNKANGIVLADAFKFVFKGGELDNVPPLNPTSLKLDEATDKIIRISWSAPLAASDGDTAMLYEVYRNNVFAGISYHPTFTDTKLAESTQYAYKIVSFDDAGNQGTTPLTGSFSTLVDQTRPKISSVWGRGSLTVEVNFDEPVNQTTAETKSNYQISGNITVLGAKMGESPEQVVLTTTQHTSGTNYTLTVNNIKDVSTAGNTIVANTQAVYQASLEPIVISVSADNEYELYVNGTLIGSGNTWNTGTRYEVKSIAGKNVIAIKGIDTGGYGGLVAEIDFMGKKYVSNDTWKVSTVEQTNWQSVSFSDIAWSKATSYGLHGTATPWASFQNVTNISTTANVNWIWSSDWENDNTVFFRLTLQTQADVTAPAAPQGVQAKLE